MLNTPGRNYVFYHYTLRKPSIKYPITTSSPSYGHIGDIAKILYKRNIVREDQQPNIESDTHQMCHKAGLPLSMQLFAICLDSLLSNLANVMTSVHIGRRTVRNTVLAYADDVTLLVTSPQDILRIKTALVQYAAATGARVNVKKSGAMAIGSWDTSVNIMDIP
jgi:trimethylamine:corrinoid methyltransferase-like protein